MEAEEEHASEIDALPGPNAVGEPETTEDKSEGGRVPGITKTRSGLRRRIPATTSSGSTEPPGNPADNPEINENIEFVQSNGKRKCRCLLCYLVLADRTKAVRHIKAVHLKEKPHRCPICPETFFRKQGLQRHLDNHSGSKPYSYKCSICSKQFAVKKSLKAHLRCHRQDQHGRRPYRCHVCSLGYWRSDHLKRHLLIHGGVRPHKCNLCEKGFFRRYGLTDHMRNCHKIE